MKSAVEEILRWDSPVQLTARRCLVDEAEVNGQRFVKGEEVMTILAAANRDPRAYDAPTTST